MDDLTTGLSFCLDDTLESIMLHTRKKRGRVGIVVRMLAWASSLDHSKVNLEIQDPRSKPGRGLAKVLATSRYIYRDIFPTDVQLRIHSALW